MGSTVKMIAQKCFILTLIFHGITMQNFEKKVCADGWIQATWVDLGCLLFNTTTKVNWMEANVFCQGVENGRLVEIQTEEQLEFVQMELDAIDDHETGQLDWWTGGNDLGREGNWMWMGSLTPVPAFVFYAGQPSGGNKENCLLLEDQQYKAQDYDCEYKGSMFPLCQQVIDG